MTPTATQEREEIYFSGLPSHCKECGVNIRFNHWASLGVCGSECHGQAKLRRYRCCPKARPNFCTCTYSTICPDHGHRCNGRHD